MKKHHISSNSSSSCSNLVLILFALIIAFTLGFLASPIVSRSGSPSPSPSSLNSLSSSSPSSSSSSLIACSSSVRAEEGEGDVAKDAADIPPPASDDGFVSHVASLPDDLLRFHYDCSAAPPRRHPAAAREAVVDELFDGTSPFESFPPPHIARLVKSQRIKGWGSDNSVFARLVRETRPRIVVELGSFLGASAIHLAKLIRKQLQPGEDFVIFCLDDFRGWPGFRKTFSDIRQEHGNVMLFNQFLQNVAVSNASGNIVPVPFATTSGLYKLCELGISADLIEVDAGHDFHSAWADINLAWSLMRPDGKSVMFGHDYFNGADYHGVRRAVDLFAKLKGLRVEPDGQHWIYRNVVNSTTGDALVPRKKKKKNSVNKNKEE